MRALIVEDNELTREALALCLERLGLEVCVAGSDSARQEAERFAPEVVYLDYLMPGTDGLTVLASLRELPGLEHLPAVLGSAAAAVDCPTQAELNAAEPIEFIRKPFEPSAVLTLFFRLREEERAA